MKEKLKVDNGGTEAKVELREWAIKKLGGAANCNVVDLYAGGGEMYQRCYQEVGSYLGFELRKDISHPAGKAVLRGDNRILWDTVEKAHTANLIDSDAYGTPWVLLNDVVKRISHGTFCIVVTDGQFRTLQTGNMHGYTRQITNYGALPDNGLIAHWRDEIVRWHINDWERHGVQVLEAVEGKSKLTKVFYYGFLCEKANFAATKK